MGLRKYAHILFFVLIEKAINKKFFHLRECYILILMRQSILVSVQTYYICIVQGADLAKLIAKQ